MEKSGFQTLVTSGVIQNRGGANRREWDGILQYVNPDPNPLYNRNLTNSSSVKDGLSNTFLFFEDAGRPLLYEDGVPMPCAGVTCPSGAPWASDQTYFVIGEHLNGRFINVTNHNEVYSFHPGGAVFAYGDQAVSFVGQDMNPETFVSHVTRDDGIGVFR